MSDFPSSIAPSLLASGLLDWIQTSGAMVSIKEADSGRYLWANAPMLAFLGADGASLAARTDLEFLPSADAVAVHAADQRARQAHAAAEDTHHFEREGQRLEFQAWRCVLQSQDLPAQILSVWRNVTRQTLERQLQQALAQIERQQTLLAKLREERAQGPDRPTDLFRREHFEDHLRREAALSQREGREFALVLLAVDRMDQLQQQRGAQGAELISEAVTRLMRGNTRAMDVLSQLGPDRYAILFSGIGLATAHARVEQLRRACAGEVLVIAGESFGFEISAGVASFPHTADSLATLSQSAIRALNDARQRGGNRVALASIQLSGLTTR